MPAAVDENLIFDSVIEVWRSAGFEAASTRKIAEKAGIAEVTLYRRFESKEKLFLAAFRNQAHVLGSETPQLVTDIETDLKMAVGAYQNLMTRLGPIVIEVMGVHLSKSLQKSLRPVASQAMGALDAIIQRYQKLGELRKAESSELVIGLVGPILAMTLLSQAGMNRGANLDLNQHVKRFIIANRPSQLP